jgi:hypothetical protein
MKRYEIIREGGSMKGVKFEEIRKQEVFENLKKILSLKNWRKFFVKADNGLYGFEFEEDYFPRSHVKPEILRNIAYDLSGLVNITESAIVVIEDKFEEYITNLRMGDLYYINFAEKLILEHLEEDLPVFIAFLLLSRSDLQWLDHRRLLRSLQILMLS